MYRTQISLFATVAMLGCLTVSCGTKSASDQTLTSDLQSKLAADPTVKPANVNVAVKDGVVTLSGDVPSSDVELAAMKIANSTTGVRSVNDQMKVNPSMAANQAPAAPNPAGAPPPPAQSPAPASPPPAATPPAQAAAPAAAPAEPPRPTTVTIPTGEQLAVRMIDGIDSARNTTGQTFRASLNAPITRRGETVIPAGSDVTVVLSNARGAGRIKGQSELEVRLASISYRGETYQITSSAVQEQGKARGKQTAIRTGIGAAAGAVIGAIAGGGKGAAIGSAAGGGAGAGFQLFTHGQQVKIPSESILTFRLEAPLTVRLSRR